MSAAALSTEQREILALLTQEFREAEDEISKLDDEALTAHLPRYCQQLQNLVQALEIAGLNGTSACLSALVDSLLDISPPCPTPALHALRLWPSCCAQHVLQVQEGNPRGDHSALQALLQALHAETMPKRCSTEDIALLMALLAEEGVIDSHDELLEITADMADLNYAEDINPALIDSMLIELPGHLQLFEQALQHYAHTEEVATLQPAHRAAHTIKGAANLVGVRALANLAHLAEELLQKSQRGDATQLQQHLEALQRCSDCMAECAEYLLHQAAPPDDVFDVLRLLSNAVDSNAQEVAETSADESEHSATATEENQAPANAPQSAADDEARIFFSTHTAQQMLNTAGELHISFQQLHTRFTTAYEALRGTGHFHRAIRQLAFELDTLLQQQAPLLQAQQVRSAQDLDPLELERLNELHAFSSRLAELTADAAESVNTVQNALAAADSLAQKHQQLCRENFQSLLNINLTPIHTMNARFLRCVRQTCRLTGKQATLEISGDHIAIDHRILARIADPLMHILRNAVDHGLESHATLREQQGKAPVGRIHLRFLDRGDTVEIRCEDDGLGLNENAILEKARARGLVRADEQLDAQHIYQLILLPGFSTRSEVTQTSGRGIGLDVVAQTVQRLKGRLHIESRPGCGCSFVLHIPTSILTAHGIVLRTRDRDQLRDFAFASRSIEQVVFVQETEFFQREGRWCYLHQEESIPLVNIEDVLGTLPFEKGPTTALLICRRSDGMRFGIRVEKIVSSQDFVIKTLNRFTPATPGVIGITLVGEGTVVPVIDAQALPGLTLSQEERAQLLRTRQREISAEKASRLQPIKILIVDDSLSARQSLSHFVSDLGYEAIAAKEGFEAIQLLKQQQPALLFVDMEMPRMNGLELTAHLRAQDAYANIPIIMISSRASERHQQLAQTAGVTQCLAKPWREEDITEILQRFTGKERAA